MTDTPEDWVLIEAAKRCGWDARPERLPMLQTDYGKSLPYRALCDMIAKHEEKPVDRKLLCAREAMAEGCTLPESEGAYRRGAWDNAGALKRCLRAIELYLEGFGE